MLLFSGRSGESGRESPRGRSAISGTGMSHALSSARYLRVGLPEPSSTRDPWRDSPVVRATEGGRGK